MAKEPLYFPSLAWFERLQALANGDPEFRRLGSVDARVGVKAGDEKFLLCFQAFRCERVQPATDDDLLEADFCLEMPLAQWQDMLQNIQEHGGADLRHTLNSLDLTTPGGISSNATGDQYRADLFFRYNESLQYFFNLSAQLDTAFRDPTPP